jgi:hypothetical protein
VTVLNGPDRRGFLRSTSTSAQTGQGEESLVHRDRDEFSGDSPFEHPANSPDVLVDSVACKAEADHLVPYGFESQRAKLDRSRQIVKLSERTKGLPQTLLLARRFAIFDVVAAGEVPVRCDQLDDRQIRPGIDC